MNRTTTLGAVAALCWAFAAEAKLELLDEIVAIVDEDVVLESEVNERLAAFKAQAKAADQPIPDEETVREQIVERLIVESLQLQTGDRAGVRISDDELNEALSSVAAQHRMNLTQFRAAVAAMIVGIKNSPRLDGVDEILVPGELESRCRNERLENGIPLPDSTVEMVRELATACGHEF